MARQSDRPVGGGGIARVARAPRVVEGDDPQTALYRALNFYPTPLWAGRAGAELVLSLDPGPWWVHEPACGQGHMATALGDYFPRVLATDVHDYGWPGQHGGALDYVSAEADRFDQVDWVITNPPFSHAQAFVELGLQRARRGVAILQRLTFLDSHGRYPLFFGETPATVVAPFFERVGMTLGGWDPDGDTATPYAWFVWMRPEVLEEARGSRKGGAMLASARLGQPVMVGIPPGTRERLTRPDDARRFGRPRPGATPKRKQIRRAA